MKIFKYILSLTMISALFVSCDAELASQDPEPIGSVDRYPTPTFTLVGGNTTFNEKDEPVFTYTIVTDRPIDRPLNFYFEQTGGDAELHTDYDVTAGVIPAYGSTGEMSVIIHRDSEFEDTESLQLTVASGPSLGVKYLVHPATVYPTLNLTIQNWLVCNWTLYTSDTYGDGWNGGYITVDIDGVTTDYAEDDDVPTTFEIPIEDGAAFSFTYVSGGGTGGSPGWESENYYVLTAPDGTEFVGGTTDYSGIPTPGVITSGTNSCP